MRFPLNKTFQKTICSHSNDCLVEGKRRGGRGGVVSILADVLCMRKKELYGLRERSSHMLQVQFFCMEMRHLMVCRSHAPPLESTYSY